MAQAAVSEHTPKTCCKYCVSVDIVRMGFSSRKRYQRYLCHSCERTFVDNGAPPGMRFPAPVITAALNEFFQEALSFHTIRRSLYLHHGVQPDHATIRRWMLRYAEQAAMALAGMRPHVGQEWVVYETRAATCMRDSRPVWLWDIFDTQTRFLLATGFSMMRRALNFEALLNLAVRRADSRPRILFTIDVVIPARGDCEIITPPAGEIRRMQRRLVGRTRILHRHQGNKSIHPIVSGWAVDWNFFHPNTELGGKTPAEAAGVNSPLKSWADIVGM